MGTGFVPDTFRTFVPRAHRRYYLSIAMRRLAILLSLFALSFAHASLAAAAPEPQYGTSYGPLPVFEFHSGFWINLHHTLYQQAKERASAATTKGTPSDPSLPSFRNKPGSPLTPAEQRVWGDALAYYTANFIGQDLLFSTDIILIKNELGDFDDCDELSGAKNRQCNAGLQLKLTQILEAAAVVYRAHLWPEHDRANRRWITRVAPLVREQGIGLSERLADIYQTHWPKAKIRVDVTEFAYSSGAYTTLDPLRVTISSTDPRNQDSAALEVLFHESSHGIAEPVQEAIIRECRQRGKAIPRDLWHALIFYTTGEVIRPVIGAKRASGSGDILAPSASVSSSPATENAMTLKPPPVPSSGSASSEPSSLREDLDHRGWDEYFKLLNRFWQPYLDGQAAYDDAIARMVSSL
jgi:hypothetical protein